MWVADYRDTTSTARQERVTRTVTTTAKIQTHHEEWACLVLLTRAGRGGACMISYILIIIICSFYRLRSSSNSKRFSTTYEAAAK